MGWVEASMGEEAVGSRCICLSLLFTQHICMRPPTSPPPPPQQALILFMYKLW